MFIFLLSPSASSRLRRLDRACPQRKPRRDPPPATFCPTPPRSSTRRASRLSPPDQRPPAARKHTHRRPPSPPPTGSARWGAGTGGAGRRRCPGNSPRTRSTDDTLHQAPLHGNGNSRFAEYLRCWLGLAFVGFGVIASGIDPTPGLLPVPPMLIGCGLMILALVQTIHGLHGAKPVAALVLDRSESSKGVRVHLLLANGRRKSYSAWDARRRALTPARLVGLSSLEECCLGSSADRRRDLKSQPRTGERHVLQHASNMPLTETLHGFPAICDAEPWCYRFWLHDDHASGEDSVPGRWHHERGAGVVPTRPSRPYGAVYHGAAGHHGTIPGRHRQERLHPEERVQGLSCVARARRSAEEGRHGALSDGQRHAIAAVGRQPELHHAPRVDVARAEARTTRISASSISIRRRTKSPKYCARRRSRCAICCSSSASTAGSRHPARRAFTSSFHSTAKPTWESGEVRNAVGKLLVSRDPKHLTQEFAKDRGGRIHIDTGRNGYSATYAAAYAVRPKPGAPISAPCTWRRSSPAKSARGRSRCAGWPRESTTWETCGRT